MMPSSSCKNVSKMVKSKEKTKKSELSDNLESLLLLSSNFSEESKLSGSRRERKEEILRRLELVNKDKERKKKLIKDKEKRMEKDKAHSRSSSTSRPRRSSKDPVSRTDWGLVKSSGKERRCKSSLEELSTEKKKESGVRPKRDYSSARKNSKGSKSLLDSKHKSFSEQDLKLSTDELSITGKFSEINLSTKHNISTEQIDKLKKSFSSLSLNRDRKRFTPKNDNFSIDHIRFLTTLDDPMYIVKTLIKNENKFESAINSKLSPKGTFTILNMLNKIYYINLEEIKGSILKKTLTVAFCENIESCFNNLFSLKESTHSKIQSEFPKNLKNIVKYFEETFYYITEYDIFARFKTLYFNMFQYLSELKESQGNLLETMINLLDKIEEREDFLNEKTVNNSYLNISVYPIAGDISENDDNLEANIVKGPYRDAEHYLSLHFKLLKEDFLDGLRNGIRQYCKELQGTPRQINHDVFVYKNVMCTEMIVDHSNTRKKILHILKLDAKPLKHTDWQTSKRFIHGSLLLLSNDAFSTFTLAILEERKFSSGSYEISISLVNESSKIKKYAPYDLIESRVFFEPYFQVLKTLKSISPSEFPLKKYILYAETVPLRPAYLSASSVYRIDGHDIILSNNSSWPDCEKLKLNHSQLKALQAGLTHDFTIIQGPPGTGKTYLGLKLIEILIENKKVWQEKDPSPIFIVCYRNQALDQILEIMIQKNKKVVRLGGQSRSEIVGKRTVKNIVQSKFGRHSHGSAQIVSELKSQIDETKCSIRRLASMLDIIKDKEGILALKTIAPILTDKEIAYFQKNSFKDYLDILNATIVDENIDEMTEESLLYDENIGFHANTDPHFDRFEERYEDPSYSISLTQLRYEIASIEKSILEFTQLYSQQGFDDFESQVYYMKLLYDFHHKNIIYNRLENILNNLDTLNTNTSIEVLRSMDLNTLNSTNRWILYKLWLNNLSEKYEEELNSLVEIHNLKIRSLVEFYEMEDAEAVLKEGVDVVGATTTGAARLSKMLKVLRPKIVIIEEAAEVLEAHVITALTQYCQHLILIGDHQQLSPSPASHKAAVRHRLDVSLFERMLLNGMSCYTLEEQHRMRPSISALISPVFYQTLLNHPSVSEYPHAMGVDVDLFFLNHNVPEDMLKDTDSHRNKFESNFVLSLTNYLMMQGYESREITILTMYGAQLHYMKQEAKRFRNLKGVEIQVVDNFQGEENRVILLSLVRSETKTVGFLAKKNRVCVALSRAQQCLYIVGNMTTLTSCSEIWRQIQGQLDRQQAVGDSLPLVCKTHRTVTRVSREEDFAALTNGGCHLPCSLEMVCGHTCEQTCHNTDLEHAEQYKCTKTCLKLKECGQHGCAELCGVPCSPCLERVAHLLPCGHTLEILCSKPPSEDTHCTEKVAIVLGCGHSQTVSCGNQEPLMCTVPCEATLECGHSCQKLCHLDSPDHQQVECTRRCERSSPGCTRNPAHLCSGQCSQACPPQCTEQVDLLLDCGHTLTVLCSATGPENPPPCPDVSLRSLPCGHELLARCSQPLDQIICDKTDLLELPCGHSTEVACAERKEGGGEVRCEAAVLKTLPCGHPAQVPCWAEDRPPEELEVVCAEMVETELSCGHTVTLVCGQRSEPPLCAQLTDRLLPCGHLLSGAPCGQPLEELQCPEQVEKIIETCGHRTIMGCGESPVQANCNAPCTKIRADCGHKCDGQCKEPCQDVACSSPVEVTGRCGHQWTLSCSDAPSKKNDVNPIKCPIECGTTLDCGHTCKGSCGQCMQARIHVPCEAMCGQLLLCGHKCESFCWHDLHSCRKKCSNKCEHRKCRNKCGSFCTVSQCAERCERRCEHYTCNGVCSEPCERPACGQACKLKLACGHACMGYCGEPCPSVCYGCEPSVDWSRYVYLNDCKHSVPEKELLEKASPLGALLCTECSTRVVTTRRYRDRTKMLFSNLPEMTNQISSFNRMQGELLTDLQLIMKGMLRAPCKIRGCREIGDMLRALRKRTWNSLQPGSSLRTNNLRTLLFMSVYLVELSGQLGRLVGHPPQEVAALVERALGLVRHLKDRKRRNLCQAEFDQYTAELYRISYLIDLRQMEADSPKLRGQTERMCRELTGDERLSLDSMRRLGEMMGFLGAAPELLPSRLLALVDKYRVATGHAADWAQCPQGHLFSKRAGPDCQSCALLNPPLNVL